MKKMITVMLAAIMLLTILSGCAAKEEEYKVIRFGHSYDATTLDPHNCYDDGSYFVLNNTNESLLVSYGGEIHPGIAESWDISEDALTATFHLRKSNWSDGTPVTAHDFVYAVERILDPDTAYENAYTFSSSLLNGEEYYLGQCSFEDVGVKALDDYTLEYNFRTPLISLYTFTGYAWAPMNKEACEKYGETYGAEADQVLTNGPFTVTEWQHESKIVIKKNENYWNAENVKIDEVQYIIGAANQVAVDLFMADQLDAAIFSDMVCVNTLKEMDLNSTSQLSGYNFVHMNCSGGSEETGPFMSNINFRKAISAAISREDIMRVGKVLGVPAYRIAIPTMTVADGRTWEEAYPLQGWSTAAEPEKAKEYLAQALEEIGCTIDDVPTFTMVCFDSQGNLDRFQAMQDMLYQTLGINCVISPQPIQQMFDLVDNGEFDFWTGGKAIEYPDWLNQVAYEYTDEPGAIGFYGKEDYMELWDASYHIVDSAERNELVFEIENYIADNMLTLHLYWTEDYIFTVPGVTGIEDYDGLGPYFAYADIQQ